MNNGIWASETAVGALVAVAVHAPDAMSKIGMTSMLAAERRLKVLTDAAEFPAADVIVVVEESVCADTLALPREVRAASPHEAPPRCVIVTDNFPDNMLVPAIECGMAAMLPRNRIKADVLARTIVGVSQGMVCLPLRLQAGLLAEFDRVVNKVLKPRGLTLSGLSVREHEVIRLLANGYDTDEIAAELAYSGSLIKKTIKELMDRYGLRSRSHAVAHAIRHGII
ncbi:response regulator transcription factor [Amycolatopsis sp. NPDC058986]|uniref:response regulator transcription factor n=1 Tax=unclassified Amycolatopsis TaxID=2618356 RepID=UPI003672180E